MDELQLGPGKTGKIWKEARGVPGEETTSKDRHGGNADIIFLNESDVV